MKTLVSDPPEASEVFYTPYIVFYGRHWKIFSTHFMFFSTPNKIFSTHKVFFSVYVDF